MYETWVMYSIKNDKATIVNWKENELGEKIVTKLWPSIKFENLEGTVLLEAVKAREETTGTNNAFGLGTMDIKCVPVGGNEGLDLVLCFYRLSPRDKKND